MKQLLNEPGEFRGLPQFVALWRAANGTQRRLVSIDFRALASLLDRADEYMREIEQQPIINECSSAPATDHRPGSARDLLAAAYERAQRADAVHRQWRSEVDAHGPLMADIEHERGQAQTLAVIAQGLAYVQAAELGREMAAQALALVERQA